MYIYKIVNKINGKEYIGKTQKTLEERWIRHLTDSRRTNTKLYNAIRKYGSENFEMCVVEYTGSVTREYLNDRERYWINIIDPEYNMTKGGDGGWINDQSGRTWKIKDTSKMKGKKTITTKVLAGRAKVSGGNNYQSTHRIHTPWGVFETWTESIECAKQLKQAGRQDVVTDGGTLRKYCTEEIILSKEGRRTFPSWRGRNTKLLGFYIEEKHEQN
jgi:group I intron endonuclease